MKNKAWFVICVKNDTPDGPGFIFGPFHNQETAHEDSEGECNREASHVLIYGLGPPKGGVRASGNAWNKSYEYYCKYPHEIPESCYDLFRTTLRLAGIE